MHLGRGRVDRERGGEWGGWGSEIERRWIGLDEKKKRILSSRWIREEVDLGVR